MRSYQEDFLQLALEQQVLRFGEFRLKSGRLSPYFFNLGQISSGVPLLRLARAYAQAIDESGVQFDLLFGPAYKGIPLATAVALAFAERGRDVPVAYNRKEAKDHGEGGVLVGADLHGRRVLLIDDVLTAGTALRGSLRLLREAGAEPLAAIIALDRQERGGGELSAVAELQRDEGIRVLSLVGVGEILEYLQAHGVGDAGVLDAVRDYQRRYGVAQGAPA